jgi:hypothetical protein
LASVLASSGVSGVVINAQAADVITLRNLSIFGGGTGTNGVRFLAGHALHIEHCSISGFATHGIDIELVGGGLVFVEDTTSQDNGGSGINALSTGTPVQVSIYNSRFDNNAFGVSALDFTFFSVTNSEASGNGQVGFLAQANGGSAAMSMANSAAGNNAIGIKSGGGSSPSSIRMAGVSVFLNTTGLMTATNGVISSFGNNNNSGSGVPNAHIAFQ